MNTRKMLRLSSAIIEKAKTLGASLAGLACVDDLKKAPSSFTFAHQFVAADSGAGGRQEGALKDTPGKVTWSEDAKSVLVIAVEHPADKPEMDWWFDVADPPGNRLLARIITDLCAWIEQSKGIRTFHMPYQVEKGGTYLKDVSVLAGLGCIGKNNLLVTPEYGPRVRLRALTLDAYFPATGPINFDPCIGCDAPCRHACPQNAFNCRGYEMEACGQNRLPGRNGVYSRPMCTIQMDKDIAVAEEIRIRRFGKPVKIIKYCRCCEFACPVGK